MKKGFLLFLTLFMGLGICLGTSIFSYAASSVEFTVASIFGDNMVLQRDCSVTVFGSAVEGTEITVDFAGQTKTGVAGSDGKWTVRLDPMSADFEGRTLTVTDGTIQKSFTGVLVGEVWLASGQSNMAYSVAEIGNAADYLQFKNYSNIRLLKIPQTVSGTYTWLKTDKVGSALNESAMSQAFALQLQKQLNVPVGVVTAAIGGSWIEQWMDAQTASENKSDTFNSLNIASSVFFNDMVAPLVPFTFAGELWYQGEANCQEPSKYEVQFKEYVQMMRGYFGNLPVLTMQLPRYNGWEGQFFPEFRLSQQNLHDEANKLYTVCGIDFGDKTNIHPKDKVEFASRAVGVALEFLYGQDIDSLSRLPVAIYEKNFETVVEYSQGTVLTTEGKIEGFEICKNGVYKEVSARIVGNTVVLSGTGDIVQYLYSPFPEKLIYDERGYAAAPFRMEIEDRICSVSVLCGTGGTVTEYPQSVQSGDSILLVFVPAEGKQLISVKVNGIARYFKGNTFVLENIKGNYLVEAMFGDQKENYNISAKATQGGSVFVSKSVVEKGEDISVFVTAEKGYKISAITMNGNIIANKEDFTVSGISEDISIVVTFVKDRNGCTSLISAISMSVSLLCISVVIFFLWKKVFVK